MDNSINNAFIRAINNEKKAELFCAVFELANGNIGITPEYTKDVLYTYIEECKNAGGKFLRIITSQQAKELKK